MGRTKTDCAVAPNPALAFLNPLKRNPYDTTTRLVFADWLADHEFYETEEVHRALASGYTALRILKRTPRFNADDYTFGYERDVPRTRPRRAQRCYEWWRYPEPGCGFNTEGIGQAERLPGDWLDFVQSEYVYYHPISTVQTVMSVDFFRKCDALAAAALAFGRLPAECQNDVLTNGQLVSLRHPERT
jgi:uncharacterized protein (TIGR02996 family)